MSRELTVSLLQSEKTEKCSIVFIAAVITR